jgi:multidrug efflux pump subunit AcrA (membrane-fusion protein)
MTANVVITTAQKDNVLIMPSRAVVQKNGGGKFVRVLVNGVIQETQATTGLRGDEGMVEVLSGVKEGDEVVTFIKNKK